MAFPPCARTGAKQSAYGGRTPVCSRYSLAALPSKTLRRLAGLYLYFMYYASHLDVCFCMFDFNKIITISAVMFNNSGPLANFVFIVL